MSLTVNGVTLNDDTLKGLIASVSGDAAAWLELVTDEMREDIVNQFDTSPAGKVYGNHVASQPGFPPNTDSGALALSIINEPGDLTRVIATGLDYATYLEFGTENMAKRPFFAPVLEQWGAGGKMEQRARDLEIIKS